MRRFRFHIGSVLILVVFLGVGFAALREADDLWDSIILSLTVGALLGSLLLAIHRKAEKRAFWVGFALLGWGYVGLTAVPSIEPRLLTSKALIYLDSKVPGRPLVITGQAWGGPGSTTRQAVASLAFSPQGNLIATSNNSGVVRVWSTTTGTILGTVSGTTENFTRIGHLLLALVLAWLGGRLSRRLHIKSRGHDPVPDPA
jgi:hypothetical protein